MEVHDNSINDSNTMDLNYNDSRRESTTLNMTEYFNITLVKLLNQNHIQQQPTSWIPTAMLYSLYSVIFLLAVIGNSLVILTLVQNKRMRTITNLFLLNLSISDLFLGVFCMPFTLVGTVLRDFVFGELMCKLLPYLQGLYFLSKMIRNISI
jgi:hypothetical protein